MQQSQEQEPFVDEILRLLHRITVDLSPLQVHTFYEAVGYMISAQPNKPQQEKLIAKLMELPNNAVRLHCSCCVLGFGGVPAQSIFSLLVGQLDVTSHDGHGSLTQPRKHPYPGKCPQDQRRGVHVNRQFLLAPDRTDIHGHARVISRSQWHHQRASSKGRSVLFLRF